MPTVLRHKGYRFFFVSYDCIEPLHIHVYKSGKDVKFWLKGDREVVLAKNHGFTTTELTFLKKAIIANFNLIKDAWDEHCK